ncbi:MAG: carbohydrate porin [Rikenellaceae bacterium]
MKSRMIYIFLPLVALLSIVGESQAQEIFENEKSLFKVSGYLRTGVGSSEGGTTQAHFQTPGALNKYSLGNQADTYGELEFDYTRYLDDAKSKSIDVVWMTSMYEDFATENKMSFNFTEQLYLRANNLLGLGESIWVGNRFYDRRAIHMLDRQWINPGQKGWGFGVENLLNRSSDEDLKFAVWRFNNKDVVSYKNGYVDNLYNYTADVRWVNKPISDKFNINLAVNYSYRLANDDLGYGGVNGFGIFGWLDYASGAISNTTALLLRQGANIPTDHWSGVSYSENPSNSNFVTSDLSRAYSLEINNNFLYDDFEDWTLNFILMAVVRNYGTTPYEYVDGQPQYINDLGRMLYWFSAGARGSYYVSDYFRLTMEYTHEYIDNRQVNAAGHLNRVVFSPEFSLSKGFYSRPALRPFVNYAFWSDDLRGHIATSPIGSPYGDKTSGFTYGLQFEVWW